MKVYIGCKVIQAEECTDQEYNRWWASDLGTSKAQPSFRLDGEAREGYRVVYPDGYVSWSPLEVFEGAYREVTGEESLLVGDINL